MYYQYFLAKNNPSLSKLSALNTDRTCDQLQTTTHTNKSSKFMLQDKFNTEHSTNEGYMIKRPTKQSMKVKGLVNNIKNAFKNEIDKIKDECRIRRTQPREQVLEMIATNKDSISLLCDRLRRMLVNKSKRSLCVDIIQELNIQITKLKNLGTLLQYVDIKILVSLSLSKIAQCYNLLYYSILLAKNAKRFSDSEPLLKYKIKAYAILSECFLKLRLKQAKIYITKYLMCSWKLNKPNEELKGYEQMGKFYFYEGNIEMAQFYHNKMIKGEILKPNSSVKRLAVAKFDQGSVGNGKKDKQSVVAEETDFNISSDDEPFEIMFAQQENDVELEKAKTNFMQMLSTKNKIARQQFQIRKQAVFDPNNAKRTKQEYENANSYIRIPKTHQTQSLLNPEGNLDLSKLKGFSRAHTQLGELKNPVLLNHLSPNRCLVNYQYIELNKASSSYKTVEGIEPIFEAGDMHKIQKNLIKLIQILNATEEWLEAQADQY